MTAAAPRTNLPSGDAFRRGGLAGWQVRRLDEVGRADLKGLTVARLAREVRLGPGYFSRAFAASFGEPPSDWLRRLRLERAAAMLQSPERSVAEVAQAVGYRDAPQLTRAFRTRFGEPPAIWRRR